MTKMGKGKPDKVKNARCPKGRGKLLLLSFLFLLFYLKGEVHGRTHTHSEHSCPPPTQSSFLFLSYFTRSHLEWKGKGRGKTKPNHTHYHVGSCHRHYHTRTNFTLCSRGEGKYPASCWEEP